MMLFMKLIHLLSIVVWVGGMFFAYVVLRPSAAEVLQPPERLRLWDKVFSGFFNWVWLAVFLVLVSGLYMIYLFGGVATLPLYINLMLLMGVVMTMIYVYVFFKCYVQFNRLVAKQEWPAAGAMLGTIRKLVGLNLTIGLLTIAVAVIGRNM
jgi:uncharacterized membrane protein